MKYTKTTFSSPALQWIEGHVLGNGDMGAVVWGTPDHLHFGVSKHNVNDLRRNPMREGWGQNYRQLAQKAVDGFRDFDSLTMPRQCRRFAGPHQLRCGDLCLEMFKGSCWDGFSQELDMIGAICKVKAKATINSVNWREPPDCELSAFVHAKQNILVIKLQSKVEQTAAFSFNPNGSADLPLPELKVFPLDNSAEIIQNLPHEQAYKMVLRPLSANTDMEVAAGAIHGKIKFGGKSGSAYLALALSANADSLQSMSEELKQDQIRKLYSSHRKWWAEFWGKSQITCYDEDIARFWYMGLYALASSTRPDKSPPNLQGIWNLYDTPPWRADFHFNTNIQMSQWIACCSNHPELQEALIKKMTGDWRKYFKDYAGTVFDAKGVALPLCSDWLGRAIGWGPLGLEMSLTAWMAQHLIDQWEFTQDKQLLKDAVFPFLLEACAFYESILHRREDGSFNIELSHSPEQICHDEKGEPYLVFGSNPTIDLVFMRILFNTALDLAELLSYHGKELGKWTEILRNLPDNPTFNGVLIDQETGFFHDGDRPGFFPHSHRHPSRLTGIYPGHEIGLNSSSEKLKLGIDSFKEFRSYGNEGFTGWSLPWQVAIAARLGLADEAESILHELKRNFTLPGMLNSHNNLHEKSFVPNEALFQIEGTIGAAAAVNEMLVQMHDGKIFLFPGIPKGKSASFRKLRLRANLLISSERKGQLITHIELLSQNLDREVRISNPWQQGFILAAGDKTIARPNMPDIVLTLKRGILYRLEPQSKAVKKINTRKIYSGSLINEDKKYKL
jgi:alpha-L-fucosidase 2